MKKQKVEYSEKRDIFKYPEYYKVQKNAKREILNRKAKNAK
jgi:hypothetical protein